jgi:hypothetical protein
MKKPAGVTKEQWAKYKRNLDLALGVMNKSLDLVADINFEAGEIVERDRIIELLQAKDCGDDFCIHDECIFAIEIIELIQEESK